MLKTSFSSIAEMIEYNQFLLSTLEALYEYEADKWNNRDDPHDTMCDPQYHNVHFNAELEAFIIPCWLSCDVTYDESGWGDPYIPYTVEISLQQVVEYMKENYGYDPYIVTADTTYMKGWVEGTQHSKEQHLQQMLDMDEKHNRDIEATIQHEREYAKLAASWGVNDMGRGWNG